MAGRAIIAGGSIAGLFAAAALKQAGWRVAIFERSAAALSGRGAGIVTHPPLLDALRSLGARLENLGIVVRERVAFGPNGARLRTTPYRQIVTSWDRMHQSLLALIDPDELRLNSCVTDFEIASTGVMVRFADGAEREADLLIGADGFRSAVRARMAPGAGLDYAGYVVWRALAQESDLPRPLRDAVFDVFGVYAAHGTQVIGYPIAGPGEDLRPGRRRYNFVWYLPTPEAALAEMLTDASGRRHALTIPPPLLRDGALEAMAAQAKALLPPPFLEVLERCERPFFTPIYDHLSPIFAQGPVALVGDAACVARPHVGMGVTKAAEDALALAAHLEKEPPAEALAAYAQERRAAARRAFDLGRRLGGYVMTAADGAASGEHPHLDEILSRTAVAV